MESTVNQRLNLIVDTFEGGNKSRFARATAISTTGIQSMLTGRQSEPSFDALLKILGAYPQVSTEWLIFGKGEMLKGQQSQTTDLHSGEATIEYAGQLASNGLLREVIDSQAKTIATQDAALGTKDKVIALLEEELKKFGGSSYAAYGEPEPVSPVGQSLVLAA